MRISLKYQFTAMSFRRKRPLRPLARGSILCHAFAFSGALILTCIQSALADALTVACTNDANGLYSYTFSKGAAPYVWGLTTNGLGLSLQSYGVIQTIQPPNWEASVDPSGLIVWTVTNGIVYLDEPVTFSVRSTFAVPRVYDSWGNRGPFLKGYVVGSVYLRPDPQPLGGGYENFNFVGPDPTALTIHKVGGNVVLDWYSGLTGFQLQATTNLSNAAGWRSVTNVPVVVNTRCFVTNTVPANHQFFRLKY